MLEDKWFVPPGLGMSNKPHENGTTRLTFFSGKPAEGRMMTIDIGAAQEMIGEFKEGGKFGLGTYGFVLNGVWTVELQDEASGQKYSVSYPTATKVFESLSFKVEEYPGNTGDLERLKHPNLHPIWAYGLRQYTSDDVSPPYTTDVHRNGGPHLPFILSPWWKNGNIAEYLKNNPDITVVEKLRLLVGIASGVVFLHGLFLIHGDLKLSNILIDDDGEPRIADCGFLRAVYKAFGPDYSRGTFPRGNRRFEAPEVKIDRSRYSFARDVYSFASVCLRVMTGREPWSELDPLYWEWLMVGWEDEQGKLHPEEIDKAEYPELPESDSLWDVLDECWNRDPNKRPTMPVVLEKMELRFREPE